MIENRMHRGIEMGSWVNVLAGAFVVAIPFITLGESSAAWWSGVVSGSLLVALALYDAYAAATSKAAKVLWTASVNVVIGGWLLVYPFFAAANDTYQWLNVVAGAVVFVTSAYSAWASSKARSDSFGRRPAV